MIRIVTAWIAYYIWRRLNEGDTTAILDGIQTSQILLVVLIMLVAIGYLAWLILGFFFY